MGKTEREIDFALIACKLLLSSGLLSIDLAYFHTELSYYIQK